MSSLFGVLDRRLWICYHSTSMDNLNSILKPFTGNKRSFILMRVAGLDTSLAMSLVGITQGTYNSWFKNEEFSSIYHQVSDLMANHRDEAQNFPGRG